MSHITISLRDWAVICRHYKMDAIEVTKALTNGDPSVSNARNLLTSPEETELKEWGKQRRFDLIALFLGGKIYEICPFYTKHGYDRILFGTCDESIQHKHYLGWNVYNTLPEANISVKKMKARIKDPKVQNKLELIHGISQTYLIKPMMNIMFEEGDKMFQNQMNRELNLNKLDGRDHKGCVTAELFARLRAQDIMKKRKSGSNVFHTKKSEHMDYKPASFIMPTRLGLSGGEKVTLQI